MRTRSLHIFALFGFAVAQPLFDLLSGNADFLVAHDLRPLDLLVLAGLLCLVFPGLLAAVETLASVLHRRVGEFVHQLTTGLLVSAIALQRGFPFWPWHGDSIPPRCPEYHVFSR